VCVCVCVCACVNVSDRWCDCVHLCLCMYVCACVWTCVHACACGPSICRPKLMIAIHVSHRPGTEIDSQQQTMQTTDRKSEEAPVCKLWFTSSATCAPACSSSLTHSLRPPPQAKVRGVSPNCTHNAQIMVIMIKWSTHERLSTNLPCQVPV
jgi:hypothetical protein